MTSKLVVNTIEADTGISSVSFASSISMSSTSKFHFGDAGIDIGADTNINRPASGVLGFNINSGEKARIDSRTASTEFKDVITANHSKQWIDTYGVIKAFKNTIDENVTIPSGTNGLSAGTTKISPGYTVTVQGEWRIV